MSAASSSSSSSTISAACSGASAASVSSACASSGISASAWLESSGGSACTTVSRSLLVQRRQHVGQVGGLEVVGAADEDRDLAGPDQVDHPLDAVGGRAHGVPGSERDGVGGARADQQPLDAGGRRLQDVELEPAHREPLAGVGDPAGPLGQQAADGGGTARGQRHAEALLDRLGRDVAVGLEEHRVRHAGRPRTSSSCSSKISPTSSSSRSSSVAMPERAAELVEHHREVAPLALHVEQQVAAGPAGRGHRHRPHGQRIARLQPEQIERVQHADDVVERLAEHRDAAVAALGEDHADVVERRVLVDGHDVGARRHDLAHRPNAERHDAADQQQLVVGPEADGGALAPDRAQVGGPGGGPGRQQEARRHATRAGAAESPGRPPSRARGCVSQRGTR